VPIQVNHTRSTLPGMARGSRLTRRTVWLLPGLALLLAVGFLLVPRPVPQASAAPLAPDFTLPAVAHGQRTLALRALRGHPVLLNFFNSQCAPCLQELPMLRQAAATYRARGVIVLGVATGGDSLSTAREFARAARLSYPIAVDEHQAVSWQYDVSAWPTSFFIDPQGRLSGQYVGPLDGETVRDGLAQAGAIACSACTRLPPASLAAAGSSAPSGALPGAEAVTMPPKAAPPFALRDQRGRLITPATLRGKVVALTFLSSICIEQCPLVGQTLSQVWRQLGRNAAHLAIVAISVDPEQDTPQATHHFAAKSGWLGTDWHYLTASRAVLSRIWAAYGVYVEAPPPIFKQSQSLVHQAGLFLIDPRGRLRAYDDAPFLAANVAATVRALQ
jgi:protein SCO1